jgi:2-isopropylmalate synthase
MNALDHPRKIAIFDTTLRDGELALAVKLSLQQKLELAQLLAAMQVDVIEVGYPGAFPQDSDVIAVLSQQIENCVICGLASSRPAEIVSVAIALKSAAHGRINVFTSVNLSEPNRFGTQTLDIIRDSIAMARHYCEDVQWSAFDATRSQPDFLCRAIETAIRSGARTVTIPDSLGVASPMEFAHLLDTIVHRIPNIDQAALSVHCHNDRGFAIENSMVSLGYGIQQIECSINGLGARAGNANLAAVVEAIANQSNYRTRVDLSMQFRASKFVTTFNHL